MDIRYSFIHSFSAYEGPSSHCYWPLCWGRGCVSWYLPFFLITLIYLRHRMLLAAEFPLSRLPFLALVLVEPTMITKELFSATIDDRLNVMNVSVNVTSARRDTWDSREAAFDWFKKRLPWKVWDPRVIRLLSVCLLSWFLFWCSARRLGIWLARNPGWCYS